MREHYTGCIGCVDFARNTLVCDYLLNYEHCRPCPVRPDGGCDVYSMGPRPAGTEESRRTWSPTEAARLLRKGLSTKQAAEKLGASRNSLAAWIRKGMQPHRRGGERSAAAASKGSARKPRGAWDEAEYRRLYRKGLNDREAAQAMGLVLGTVARHRKGLGLPPNGGRSKKKGAGT